MVRISDRSGFTLIELMVVAAIIGAIAMMGPQIITQSTKFFILSRTKLTLQREARGVMYIITRELNQAQNATIVIDQANGQPYYSRIRFNKIQGTAVTITQTGTNLTLKEGTDNSTLTTHLSYLVFTFPHTDDMTIISVAMTLQQQIYGGAFKALHMASEQVQVMD